MVKHDNESGRISNLPDRTELQYRYGREFTRLDAQRVKDFTVENNRRQKS